VISKKLFEHCPPQNDLELMAGQKILGLQAGTRLEQISNEHSERMPHRKLGL
jgi:hypothetical protein